MNKKTIWKSFDLFTKEEEKEFVKFVMEDGDYSEDEAYRIANEWNDDYFDDDFGKHGNASYCEFFKDKEFVVTGSLGLWNGRHEVNPKTFKSLNDAVFACLEDIDEIYEDRYGNLCINAYHHDGCNRFVIKLKTDKGLRCVRYTERV